jgi:hypothetical protein
MRKGLHMNDKNERKTDPGNRDRTLVVVPKKNDLYFFFTWEHDNKRDFSGRRCYDSAPKSCNHY